MDTKPIQPRPILDLLLTDNNTEIVNNKPTIISKGLRKCGVWLQRMEHLEMAGAPARTPGTDGLTINDLPDDMMINIFCMMDTKSLLAVANVCTRWRQLCKTPYIWKYVYHEFYYSIYEEVIENILPIFGNYLTKIKIYVVYDLFRASLIRYCPNLTHLESTTCSILIDLHHWPHLKFLSFDAMFQVEPDCDYNLSFVAKNLKTLKIDHHYSLPRETKLLVYLLRSCPNLTRLEIYRSELEDSSIFDDLHLFPNLKFLSFDRTTIDQPHGANRNSAYNLPFEKLKCLETLILSTFSLTRDSLYSMLECEHLANIDMRDIKNISADFLESLVRTKQSTLRELYIYGDTLNDDIMRHISNCRQLQKLFIQTCDSLSDSSLLHLSSLKNLQSLELCYGYVSESAILAFISNNIFQQMTFLRLPDGFPLSRQVIEIIKRNAPNLRKINISLKYNKIVYVR